MNNNIKVLFAVDFSEASKEALVTAKLLVQHYQADIDLIHVLTHFWRYFASSGLYEKEAVQRLATWAKQLYPDNNRSEDYHVYSGNAAEQIVQKAEQFAVDLILLGGESVKSKDYFITGTTAESIVRYAKQSVWLAKKDKINRIICGIDGSAASAKALTEALKICKDFSAELCIIHAIPAGDFNPLGMNDEELKQSEEQFKEERLQKIGNFLQQFDLSEAKVKKEFTWGAPSRLILNYAEDFDYDLIVIGATGESLLKQVVMGTTAEKILRNTPCSLLVVR